MISRVRSYLATDKVDFLLEILEDRLSDFHVEPDYQWHCVRIIIKGVTDETVEHVRRVLEEFGLPAHVE